MAAPHANGDAFLLTVKETATVTVSVEGGTDGAGLPADALRAIVSVMDLTSLGDKDDEESTRKLATKAVQSGNRAATDVAAICVWGRLAPEARAAVEALKGAEAETAEPEAKKRRTDDKEAGLPIQLAAVANFPTGQGELEDVIEEVRVLVEEQGVDEVDLVINWRSYVANLHVNCKASAPHRVATRRLVKAVRGVCDRRDVLLKVILESGELEQSSADLVAHASADALAAGAHFLKTSTGKTKVGATPGAARIMLQALANAWIGPDEDMRLGFKASGGIRTPMDAMLYMKMTETALGQSISRDRKHFRLGVSGLMGAVEAQLEGQVDKVEAGGY